MTVRTEEGGRVPFKFYPEQKYIYSIVQMLRDPLRRAPALLRIYKSRRRGASTMFVLDLLHRVLFSDSETHGQIYGHERDSGDTLFTILKTFYDNVPEEMTKKLTKSVDRKWHFDNNGEILVKTIKADGLSRGSATNYMLMTEVGMYRQAKKINEVLSGLTLTPNLTIVQESTSNGYDDYWYQQHLENEKLVQSLARKHAGRFKMPTPKELVRGHSIQLRLLHAGLWPRDEFFHVFIPWFWNKQNVSDDPDQIEMVRDTLTDYERMIMELYDLSFEQIAWRRSRSKIGGSDEQLLKQEYPCSVEESFVSSSTGFFEAEKLSQVQSKIQLLPSIETVAQERQMSVDAYISELNSEEKLPDQVLVRCDLEYVKAPKEVGHNRFQGRLEATVKPTVNYIGRWIVFSSPVPGYKDRYIVACDPAEGKDKSDTTTMIVFDRLERKFVALGFGLIGVEDTPLELAKVGTWYNFAPILVEKNGPGQTVLLGLKPRYIDIMRTSNTSKGYDDFSVSELGIYMLNARGEGTKYRAANLLKSFIEEIPDDSDGSEIPFVQITQEMGSFDKVTLKAIAKNHDDFVMVAMIALEGDRLLYAQGRAPKALTQTSRTAKSYSTVSEGIPSSRCF